MALNKFEKSKAAMARGELGAVVGPSTLGLCIDW